MNNELSIHIPSQLENLQLPSPELLTYYTGIQRRILWIDDFIDESLLFQVKQILNWNCEDVGKSIEQRQPIRLLIFSPGGELDPAFSLIDAIRLSETPVTTINMGNAMSAGLYILLAGHKRYCLPHSIAMWHQGSSVLGGSAGQTLAAAQQYKSQLDRIKDYTLSRTKITPAQYKKRQEDDWYFDAKDQLKYGIVDAVVESMDKITCVEYADDEQFRDS